MPHSYRFYPCSLKYSDPLSTHPSPLISNNLLFQGCSQALPHYSTRHDGHFWLDQCHSQTLGGAPFMAPGAAVHPVCQKRFGQSGY